MEKHNNIETNQEVFNQVLKNEEKQQVKQFEKISVRRRKVFKAVVRRIPDFVLENEQDSKAQSKNNQFQYFENFTKQIDVPI